MTVHSIDADAFSRLRAADGIGRQLGDERFFAAVGRSTARDPRPGERDPEPKGQNGN